MLLCTRYRPFAFIMLLGAHALTCWYPLLFHLQGFVASKDIQELRSYRCLFLVSTISGHVCDRLEAYIVMSPPEINVQRFNMQTLLSSRYNGCLVICYRYIVPWQFALVHQSSFAADPPCAFHTIGINSASVGRKTPRGYLSLHNASQVRELGTISFMADTGIKFDFGIPWPGINTYFLIPLIHSTPSRSTVLQLWTLKTITPSPTYISSPYVVPVSQFIIDRTDLGQYSRLQLRRSLA